MSEGALRETGETGVRVRVDRRVCMGSQSCVWRAPATFRIEDGKARAADPTGDPLEALLDAEGSCPGFAISVETAG